MNPTVPPDCRPVADPDDPRRGMVPGHAVRPDGAVLYYSATRRKWVPLVPKVGAGEFRKVRIRTPSGKVREMGLALIVLRAFAGPRPTGFEPLHFPDPDPGNNRADNLRWAPRGASKVGRMLGPTPPPSPHGDDHPHAVLCDEDVQPVRDLYRAGFGYKEVADKYGVDPETVRCLLLGKTWKHVPDPQGEVVMRPRGSTSEGAALAKLSRTEAEEIKGHLAAGMGRKQIASIYEVSKSCVNDIAKGRTWREC